MQGPDLPGLMRGLARLQELDRLAGDLAATKAELEATKLKCDAAVSRRKTLEVWAPWISSRGVGGVGCFWNWLGLGRHMLQRHEA